MTKLKSHDPVGHQPAAVRAVTSARTKLLAALGGAIAGGAVAGVADTLPDGSSREPPSFAVAPS